MPILRFAPAPSGAMHPGNCRSALVNYVVAKILNGELCLRIDDTNAPLVREDFIKNIYCDMNWLGIFCNRILQQSERQEYYKSVFKLLLEANFIYSSTSLTESNRVRRAEAETQNTQSCCWRFEIQKDIVIWNDLIRGKEKHEPISMTSDPIVFRSDGSITYLLASVIDDIVMGITHIVRGRDHISNTAIQIQMMHAILCALKNNGPLKMKDLTLSYESVQCVIDKLQFAHLPLLSNEDGSKFSKRAKSLSIDSLRNAGVIAMSINNYLLSLGSSEMLDFDNMSELIEHIRQKGLENFFQSLGNSDVRFSLDNLWVINQKLISRMSFKKLIQSNLKYDLSWLNEDMWECIRSDMTSLEFLNKWREIFFDEIDLYENIVSNQNEYDLIDFFATKDEYRDTLNTVDSNFFEIAKKNLPISFDSDNWSIWTNAISNETELKGKGLFMPLRLAITGMKHGPKMADIFRFFDKTVVLHRLNSAIKYLNS
ncbi:glutamate--tRNA ligase [Candidatus Gromoviella agglomerans]|uniref:glutamate--tRNA ligase n=1 Tax=Candidatus Gromoviella agglomerans TaxID=2806609 RepID=UPI001E62013D|nr:glutamate--tRNA ligase family protein [Candidatus Gromoviella agglomerans]UFX98280.1 Glutamate--tRNA ligase [Candidatus Gromoviella agglomerans]